MRKLWPIYDTLVNLGVRKQFADFRQKQEITLEIRRKKRTRCAVTKMSKMSYLGLQRVGQTDINQLTNYKNHGVGNMFGGTNSIFAALKQAGAAAVVGLMVYAGASSTDASAAVFDFSNNGPDVLSLNPTVDGITVLITATDENDNPEVINQNNFGLGVGPGGSIPEDGEIAGGETLTFDFSPAEVAAIKAVVFQKGEFEETFDLIVDGVSQGIFVIAADAGGGGNFETFNLGGIVGQVFQFVGLSPNDPENRRGIRITELVVAVPLPAALPLMAGGLALMGFMGWRRKNSVV